MSLVSRWTGQADQRLPLRPVLPPTSRPRAAQDPRAAEEFSRYPRPVLPPASRQGGSTDAGVSLEERERTRLGCGRGFPIAGPYAHGPRTDRKGAATSRQPTESCRLEPPKGPLRPVLPASRPAAATSRRGVLTPVTSAACEPPRAAARAAEEFARYLRPVLQPASRPELPKSDAKFNWYRQPDRDRPVPAATRLRRVWRHPCRWPWSSFEGLCPCLARGGYATRPEEHGRTPAVCLGPPREGPLPVPGTGGVRLLLDRPKCRHCG